MSRPANGEGIPRPGLAVVNPSASTYFCPRLYIPIPTDIELLLTFQKTDTLILWEACTYLLEISHVLNFAQVFRLFAIENRFTSEVNFSSFYDAKSHCFHCLR